MEPSANTFHAISCHLPEKVLQGLRSTPVDELALDNLVRLISGAEASPHSAPDVLADWTVKQTTIAATLSCLSRADNKRSRDHSESDLAPKRPRLSPPESSESSKPTKPSIDTGRPIYSLQPISTTAPVRKKVDLVIREHALVLLNSTTKTPEGSSIPLSILRRAFILPTRGKTKPHWTVVILSSDSQPLTTRGKQSTTAIVDSEQPQIIFGIDSKLSSTVLTTTTYDAEGTPSTTTHLKNTDTLPILRDFLSHIHKIQPILEPTPTVFKSAVPSLGRNASPDGVPGVEAYRAAKSGSLWFMREGILWGESKPCEFWGVEDLIGRTEGLKIIGGIGKTCSVILTRRSRTAAPAPQAGDKNTSAEGTTAEDELEEDLGEETEFSMVDSKEKEGIENWVKQHRHMFGTAGGRVPPQEPTKLEKLAPVGPLTIHQMADESDLSDEDFAASSSDDDSSEGDLSSEGSGEEGDEGDETEEDSEGNEGRAGSAESGEGDGEEEEEEEELDPKHHPLLRAGRLPKMSKAVMDIAVGMVVDDLVAGDDDDEIDELMD